MAIRSYDVGYVETVAVNVGTMFEYAVACGYDAKEYWNTFISSDVAKQIEKGNPRYLVGYSAIDLLNLVLHSASANSTPLAPQPFFSPSEFYWAGWALAQYQNYKTASFFYIGQAFPIDKVLSLYGTLHEADITKFFAVADEYLATQKRETNLKRIRKAAGLSQKQLAQRSEVSVRNIQTYEQRQNDINKAQADILFRLSKALGCNLEDLFEE